MLTRQTIKVQMPCPSGVLVPDCSGSDNATGVAVQGKGGRRSIRAVPGPVKTRLRGNGLARRDGAIIRDIGDSDITAALGIGAIPQLSNRLPVGEREPQAPAIDGR